MSVRKRSLSLMILGVAFFNVAFIDPSFVWEKGGRGIRESEVSCVAVHPNNELIVFAGTSKAIYKSTNGGQDFELAFQIPGSQPEANFLYIGADFPEQVFAATNSGLFFSKDAGKVWERIFYSNSDLERQCFSVTANKDATFLGTADGLFVRENSGSVWQKRNGVLAHTPIYDLSGDKEYIYVATASDIFRTVKDGKEFDKVFSVASQESSFVDVDENSSDAPQDDVSARQIKRMGTGEFLYVTTQKGIFRKHDQDKAWQRVESDGLPVENITSLTILENEQILAGTRKGIFLFDGERWTALYKGLETNQINFLVARPLGAPIAATDRGIFVLKEGNAPALSGTADYAKIQEAFKSEPAISLVQKMAVNYAEVNPEKIKGWRSAAQKKAWYPSVSLSLDQDRNRTIGDSIYGSSSSGGSSYIGPDDKTFYDNFGWGVALSWDLGDVIWSSDQTSIDSRSKLMVELREDILDQVTRLYFERRRLQMELVFTEDLPPVQRIDKEMRIEELTALLDGFTGGGFSKQAKEVRHD